MPQNETDFFNRQKGIDLIADAFPAILALNPKVQLIAIGPVIDLHGKFAALKLDKLMKLYPGRVCSKPVFTALPPFVFSGAEFALIPSRDEPFGLVAVEFGRKGALGVGARVGQYHFSSLNVLLLTGLDIRRTRANAWLVVYCRINHSHPLAPSIQRRYSWRHELIKEDKSHDASAFS